MSNADLTVSGSTRQADVIASEERVYSREYL